MHSSYSWKTGQEMDDKRNSGCHGREEKEEKNETCSSLFEKEMEALQRGEETNSKDIRENTTWIWSDFDMQIDED